MTLALDSSRWTAKPVEGDAFEIVPAGSETEFAGLIRVERRDTHGTNSCAAHARAILHPGLYDDPDGEATTLGEVAARRFVAPTRCRNLTPRGVVVCGVHAGSSYTISSTIESCQSSGADPFSDVDPLAEVAASARFGEQ